MTISWLESVCMYACMHVPTHTNTDLDNWEIRSCLFTEVEIRNYTGDFF